jgi:dihydroorotate dehydrogenase (fumarate)
VEADLAVTGGVHHALDTVKALSAGTSALQIVSALLLSGPARLTSLRREVELRLEEHESRALAPSIGSLSHRRCASPCWIERADYARILQTGRPR